MVADDRAVPLQRPALPPDAARPWRAALAPRQLAAVHGRRRGRLVAPGHGRGRHRPRGLLPGAAHLEAGTDPRQPDVAAVVPKRDSRLYADWRPRLEARHLRRLPDDEGQRRARGTRGEAVVPDGEVAGSRRALRRAG